MRLNMKLFKNDDKRLSVEFSYVGYIREEFYDPEDRDHKGRTVQQLYDLEINNPNPNWFEFSKSLKNAGILPKTHFGKDGGIQPAILEYGAKKKHVLKATFTGEIKNEYLNNHKALKDPAPGIPFQLIFDPTKEGHIISAKTSDGQNKRPLTREERNKYNATGNFLDIGQLDNKIEIQYRDLG